MDPLTEVNLRTTPQSEQADPRQVENSAGGFTFALTGDARLLRFLTLGTDGGTYYVGERELTQANAKIVIEAARTNPLGLVDLAVKVSQDGRAPRNNPALFALAAAAGLAPEANQRRYALDALPKVARTGTHLFTFVTYAQQFRGWGRSLRNGIGDWYLDPSVERLAYQMLKYRNRNGWTHRDLLRKAHPYTEDRARKALFDWTCGREADLADLPLVRAFEQAQRATLAPEWVRLVEDNPDLSWEMLPDEALTKSTVWGALIAQGMPQTALLRQLPRLTTLGVLKPGSSALRVVVEQLPDSKILRRARVHPVNVLVALRTYSGGHGIRGKGEWIPVAKVIDALDAAFYAAFSAVEPSGKRILLALDVSGSMTSQVSGLPISCREATAALALVTAATEPNVHIVGFTSDGGGWQRGDSALVDLPISPRQRLDDAIRVVSNVPFGGTDVALPMVVAKQQGWEVDSVVIFTDNETWAGKIHPHQALADYRAASGIATRQVVVGMTATDFTVADPSDRLSLDVAGFDSAVPNLVSDFTAGRL